MSVLDRPDDVPVPLGFCPCDGLPHPDGDIVWLLAELPASLGVRARSMLDDAITGSISKDVAEGRLADVWLRVCVSRWTFLFDDGSPIPVTPENVVRALPFEKGGRLVADKADDLYAASVLTPLVERLNALSKHGSTASSRRATSATKPSTRTRRSRSSTATTGKVPPPG